MGRTFACSDLHGMLCFWTSIIETLNPDDKIYVLGDCGDRGPQSWETLEAVLNEPRAILLKGNHEDMLEKALLSYLALGDEEIIWSDDFNLLAYNGGSKTFAGARKAGHIGETVRKLKELSIYQIYTNTIGEKIYLSHAGFTPWKDANGEVEIPNETDLIWDRNHFFDRAQDLWDDNVIIVHGHTPIPHLLRDLNIPKDGYEGGALWYADGRKCCIDCGAVFIGQCVLLDLDTWEEQIFVK